jgi:trimeric autotransporter adhesin
VTLTYSNTGIGAANGVIITDNLPTTNTAGEPITLDYVAGSGRWSDNPGVVLTDASGNTEATNAQGTSLEYETAGATTVTARLDTLAPGRSGTLRFSYQITAALQGTIENIALVESDTQSQTSSNPSPVSVDPSADLVVADAAAVSATPGTGVDGANLDAADASASDDDGAQDDVTTEADDVFAGESMVFDLVLTNLGNEADTILLDVANGDFPVGTSFSFVAVDGITPLVGDKVDLASGGTAHVRLVASLPADTPATAAPAGFDATVTATSRKDGAVSNTSTILFNGAVLTPPVDLVNTDGAGGVTGGVGNGAVDDGGNPWQTLTVRPGETAVFPLRISVDAGAPANTFDLLASTDASFATLNLPNSWSVEFFDASGVKITSTGALTPSAGAPAVFDYEARVFVPANAQADAAGTGIYFRADSPVNGASDSKLDAVTIEEVVDVAIEADTVAQAAPGGVAIVPHTITNLGNSTLTAGGLSVGGSDPFTGQGISAAVFYDANDDGVLDAGDPLITDISQITGTDATPGLSQGEQARVFVRAQVPSTASFGIQETGDLTLATSLTTENGAATDEDTANNTVFDTITIISGDMVITKEQAVDADCDGTPEGSYSLNALSADPGACIAYRLIADNTGTEEATNVVINDTVPGFTTLETCTADACAPALTIDGAPGSVDIAPPDEGTGSVASSAQNAGFSLSPGSRAVLTFSVEIDA